jgi:hypothetical protein
MQQQFSAADLIQFILYSESLLLEKNAKAIPKTANPEDTTERIIVALPVLIISLIDIGRKENARHITIAAIKSKTIIGKIIIISFWKLLYLPLIFVFIRITLSFYAVNHYNTSDERNASTNYRKHYRNPRVLVEYSVKNHS